MTDSLTIFGTQYTNVKGFKAEDGNNNTLTYIRPQGSLSITENSSGIDVTEYATVSVNVASSSMTVVESSDLHGGTIVDITGGVVSFSLQSKAATPSASIQYIAADSGYNGLSVVTVEAIPSTYVIPSGTKTITANASGIDVTTYAAVDVAVSGGSGTVNLQTKTNIDPTESSQTITADIGYDGLNSVQINAISSSYVGSGIDRRDSTDLTVSGATVSVPAGYYASAGSKAVDSGTEGTPTATKGTVSSHSVTVTPSVTNAAGYISGGTHTGTGVTVSASELVSGTLTISSSGTTDVTNYASVSVAAGSATTPATTVTANPSISVDSSGLITATASATKSVTPTVSAGYVSSGMAGTITVSGSNTSQLTVQAAQTIHPSTSDQTIASGKYLTGTQTIKAVTTTNLIASNILSGVTIKVGDSTDDDCVASVAGSVTFQTYYTGSSTPSAGLGVNGDIYLQTSS